MIEHDEMRNTVFGEVICELFESRDLLPTPEAVAEYVEACGCDGEMVLDRMKGVHLEHVGYFDEFSRRLDLSEAEIMHLAFAYAIEERWGADRS